MLSTKTRSSCKVKGYAIGTSARVKEKIPPENYLKPSPLQCIELTTTEADKNEYLLFWRTDLRLVDHEISPSRLRTKWAFRL